MLIGISGKIGSGKDTVGKIIQYLSIVEGNKPKATVSFEEFEMAYNTIRHDWEIKKFAHKLKIIAHILTGVPIEKFEDQEFKKQKMGPEWSRLNHSLFNNSSSAEYHTMTWREFLQKLGTEAMRDQIHPNVWVNALFADYVAINKYYGPSVDGKDIYSVSEDDELLADYGPVYPNWIITDVRFPNEAQAIKGRGGIVVRVNRPYQTVVGQGNGNWATFNHSQFHPSETALDDWKFDYEIKNDGTIEDLIEKVKSLLKTTTHYNYKSS